ncbi:MAG: HAD-IA family hydrolase [Paracoccaceae bacterium]
MRCVIFDLDGTLADTSGDLISAANRTFRSLGMGDMLSAGRDAAVATKSIEAMLELGFERAGRCRQPDRFDELNQMILDSYGENIDQFTYLYPGAFDAITRLVKQGHKTGICTNKPEHLALDLMSRLGARDLFASLIGGDTLSVSKPDPAPLVQAIKRAGGALEQSVMIGDTVNDLKTARAAGVPCALVTFGPLGPDVAKLEPDALLHHFDDLDALVRRLVV